MPIDYKKYAKNWMTEIRPAILERAGNCCEFCKVQNYAVGRRHVVTNNNYDNLKALYQKCHLDYDKEEHKKKRFIE